jgi:GT2 family glycosyltransferase
VSRVSVVIPVLDQWSLTERCLRTLAQHAPDSLEVIVVDNASTDETQASCPTLGRALFGQRFTYLRQEANLNFGPASNLGAASARGEYLFLLNNDTELSPGWLPPLLKALDNPKIGAAGPRLLYPDGRAQHVGTAFSPQLTPTHLFEHFPGDHPVVLARRRCQAITAAAMLVPAAIFRDMGGFFEGFRNGSEDLDLCARIRARGLQLAVCPDSVVIHHTSRSAGRFDHDDANADLLRQRQAGAFAPDLHLFARQAGYSLRLTPWLAPFLAGPGLSVTAHEAKDSEILREKLCSEPLWKEGYGLLAAAASEGGDHALALECMFLQSHFFPDIEHYRQLHTLAATLGRDSLAEDVARKIQVIEARLADRQKLRSTAQALAAHFRTSALPELHALYRDWLAVHNRPN